MRLLTCSLCLSLSLSLSVLQLLDVWRPAAAFTVAEERGKATLTYEIYVAADEKQLEADVELVAFETYASRQAREDHMGAKVITTFLAAAAPLCSRAIKLGFLHPRVGFHTRGEKYEAQIRAKGGKCHMLVATINFASSDKMAKVSAGHSLPAS